MLKVNDKVKLKEEYIGVASGVNGDDVYTIKYSFSSGDPHNWDRTYYVELFENNEKSFKMDIFNKVEEVN